MINGLYIALIVVLLWFVILYALSGPIRKSRNFSLYGPALMIKTSKDRKILDRVSARFPGVVFSRFSVGVFLIWGFLSLIFLIYEAYLVSTIHLTSSPPLNEYLVIPGINPAIPIFYGTFALFIGVVIHELMHGVVSRKHNIKVNAVGALFFVVPVGAFVEPDQEEIIKADPVVRRRIFASGAGVNIIIAIVAFLVVIGIMMPAAQPIHQGFYVDSVDGNFLPSSGIQAQSEIVSVNGVGGNAFSNLTYNSTLTPGTPVSLSIFDGKTVNDVSVPAGLVIDAVQSGYPAEKANISAGSVIYSVDSRMVSNINLLTGILDNITPHSTITITTITYSSSSLSSGTFSNHTVVTASKYDYYSKYYPTLNREAYRNASYIGVETSYMGILGAPLGLMKQTVFGYTVFQDFPTGMFQALALPFQGLSPVPSHMEGLFSVSGPAWLFWGTMNTLFWLAYINFLLAMLNTLPAAILDGGQFFKDTLTIASKRRIFKVFRKERNISVVANFLTFLVLFILLYLVIAPRLL